MKSKPFKLENEKEAKRKTDTNKSKIGLILVNATRNMVIYKHKSEIERIKKEKEKFGMQLRKSRILYNLR